MPTCVRTHAVRRRCRRVRGLPSDSLSFRAGVVGSGVAATNSGGSAWAPTPPASRVLKVPLAPTNGFRTHETIRDVHFGPGRSDALWADTRVLDGAVGWLNENPTRLLRIKGYTDGSGTREQNLSIGEKRARFVMKYLMSKGVEAARITIASNGVQLLVKER